MSDMYTLAKGKKHLCVVFIFWFSGLLSLPIVLKGFVHLTKLKTDILIWLPDF